MTPRPSSRAAIMDAALSCFAQSGYDATRIRDIAQAAGVSEGALYRHFASKEELARELHLQAMSLFGEELVTAAQGGAPVESLRRMAARVLALYRERPAAFVFALVQAPPAALASMPAENLPIDIITGVIERVRAEGRGHSGSTRVLAACYLGCLMQPISLSLSAPGCVHDVLADDSADATIVEAALGAIGVA